MAYVERSIIIEGPIEQVYELAKDMEAYPNFMPDVESVKVIEREPKRTVTEWETSVDGTPILWTEEDLFDDENFVIDYRLIEGDLDKFEGQWRFSRQGTSTKVILTVDYDFGIPELTNLIGPTLEQKVGENSEMMLTGMKRRIEGS
ncbi:MAG: aromatase/cyclase [Candidatus Eremiobacteraeota bacterium]|nr:aromatase/cyclase [Candidatus Eremiobacteraeota bacterium]